MTSQGQIPAPHVLIAAFHRFARSADAALALVCLMYKALAIAAADNHVVPKRELLGAIAARVKRADQIRDLRALARAVEAGEGDEQSFPRVHHRWCWMQKLIPAATLLRVACWKFHASVRRPFRTRRLRRRW